jgi:hypothetical protein
MTLAAALAASGITPDPSLPLDAQPSELPRASRADLTDAPLVEVEVAHPRTPSDMAALPSTVLYLRDVPDARDPAKLRAALALAPETWTMTPDGRVAVPCGFRLRYLPAGIGAKSSRAATKWLGVPAAGRPPGVPAKRPDRVKVHVPGVGYVEARMSPQGSDDEPVYALSMGDVARIRGQR